jgi:hypothetical protein
MAFERFSPRLLILGVKRALFVPTSSLPFSPSHLIIPLLLHSSLPHSSNATYTYNGLGIISFHKDGVLIGSRMLSSLLFINVTLINVKSPYLLTPKDPWVFWCKTTQNYPLLKMDM